MSSTAPTQNSSADRLPLLVWLLVLLMWGGQVRYPQLGYPATGAMLSGLLACVLAVVGVWYWQWMRQQPPARYLNLPAVAGFVFVAFYLLRWAVTGFAAVGDDPAGTILQTAAWAMTAYYLFRIAGTDHALNLRVWLLRAVSLLAIACGIHALLQYFYLYDQSLADLRGSLNGAEPTPLQMGLMHHFELKRVASVWGDPNILAGFSAMSLPASATVAVLALRARRERDVTPLNWVWLLLSSLSIVLAGVAIALSGSRGGLLDAALAALLSLAMLVGERRRIDPGLIMLIAAALFIGKVEHARAATAPPQPTAWTWRSTTIQERVNYMRVGAAMFRQSPVVGLGPGSVDLYFGRFKPADAREAKYLHNWVIQLAAETGAVGVSLAVLFLALLFWQTRGSTDISTRTLAIVAGVFVFDALLQLSFNHHEIMALFGLCCGALFAARPTQLDALASRSPASRLIHLAAAGFVSLAIITLVVPRLVALDYRQRANDAIESADSPSAIHLLRLSQQWEPGHPGTYLSLAQLEEQNGQLSSALLLIEKAVRVQPESAAARAALAHVQARLRNFDQADEAMKEALARYPTNPNYNGQMAELLLAYARMENDAGRRAEADRKRASALEYARKAAQFSTGVPGAEHWPAFYQQLLSTGAK